MIGHNLFNLIQMAEVMRFLRFCFVGGLGFIADAASFALLLHLNLDLLFARVLAFWLAIVVTWLGNRYFTFSQSGRSITKTEFGQYLLLAHLSGLFNLTSFYFSFAIVGTEVAFVFGIAVGLVCNYLLVSKLYCSRMPA